MPNNIAAIKNYATILDRVYQRGGHELVPELAGTHGPRGPQCEGNHDPEDLRLWPG